MLVYDQNQMNYDPPDHAEGAIVPARHETASNSENEHPQILPPQQTRRNNLVEAHNSENQANSSAFAAAENRLRLPRLRSEEDFEQSNAANAEQIRRLIIYSIPSYKFIDAADREEERRMTTATQ